MKIVFFLSAALGHFVWAAWLFRRFPALRTQKRWIYAAGITLSLVSPVVRGLSLPSAPKSMILSLSAVELMTVLLSAVFLGLFLFGKAALESFFPMLRSEWGRAQLPEISKEEEARIASAPESLPPSAISRREALERMAGFAALAGTGSMLGWGMIRGRHAFEIVEVPVKIPGLPKALDGYTLAQISDIHVGTFVQERELEEGLSLVRSVKPDLIVATGDLVDYDPAYIPLMARTLSRLEARDGVAAILGNHDHYTDALLVRGALEQAGVKMLVNDAVHLRKDDGGGFALLGVDDYASRRVGPRLDRAITKAPSDRPRILLAHQPRFFEDSAGQVALQLSGHTHGGQINPGVTPAHLFMRFVKGRYELGGSTLWVNRGFGTAGPPSRVGAPPEITKIVLVSA